MGAGHRRDRPREAPAVAVEHRQGPQIDRVLPHAPDQNIAERIQISAAMVIDDALGVAGRARGIVERDRVPLVRRRQLPQIRGRRRRERLRNPSRRAARRRGPARSAMSITIGFCVEPRQRFFDHRCEFGVGDQHLGLAMAQDEGNRVGVEADVERVEHRARPSARQNALRTPRGCSGAISATVSPRPTPRAASAAASRRQRSSACAPAVAPLAIGDGEPARIDRGRAPQKADRRQRHKIGRVFVEPGFVRVGIRRAHRRRLYERDCGKRAVSGGSPSQGCINSSYPDEAGAGKVRVGKAADGDPAVVGLRSPSQKTLLPQFGQKWKRSSKPLSAIRP